MLGSLVIVVLILGLAIGLLALRSRLVPDIGLDIAINGSRHIEARRGDKLLGALHDVGVMIPAACGGSGTCGLCRVTVTEKGQADRKPPNAGYCQPKIAATTSDWPAKPHCGAIVR